MSSRVEVIIEAKDKFSGAFSNFTKGLGPLTKGVGIVAGAMGAFTTAVVANTQAVANNYDSIQKFSDRIGISTEALSKYEYIAERSGVKIAALRMGFQRMTRRIAEASMGTGIAIGALEKLNISIDDIAGRKPDQQFEILAEALLKVEDQGQRAALAMKFFDSEGVALLQTLAGGIEGLEQLKEEAEKFGIVVSEQAGKNAAAFNDSITMLKSAFMGLRNYLAEQTMPILTDLARTFAYFIAENRPAIINFAETVARSMLTMAEYSAYAVGVMIDAWRGLKMIWHILKIAFLELAQTIQEGVDFIAEKIISMLEKINVAGVFDSAIEKARSFTDHNKEAISVMEEMIQKSFDNLDSLANEGLAIERINEFVEMAKEKFAELREDEDTPGMFQKALGLTEEDIEKTTENAKKLTDTVLQMGYDASDEHKKLSQSKVKTDKKEKDDMFKALSNFTIKGWSISKVLNIKEAIANTHAGAIAAYKAMAEIPIIGPALGAAAAAAVMAYGAARQAQIAGLNLPLGQAHGGLGYVPNEGTYLLSRGERVLAPEQNKDLTEALAGGLGGNVAVERINISVAENAINADTMLTMSEDDWAEVVREKIYPALEFLSYQGFKTV